MSEAKEYLAFVEERLKESLRREMEGLRYGKDEIHKMNEFFWENYTEMDEYGYEDYDNQQALLRQADANAQKKATIRKLMKLQDSPFFGGLAFQYEDEDEPEMFYIGIGDYSETPGETLIFDWRAPVSSMFYDYDKGPAGYQAPMGYLEGELLHKHQYKIRRGQMVYEFENETKIDDEILMRELGKHGSVQMRNIIRTIQAEQNRIIRNREDRVMIIQGAAGSGKTSIALHRIAYLLYHEREHLRSSQVLILSPNGVFTDYISHILPELGEENIREMSFDVFAYHQLKDTVADIQDKYQQLEGLMAEKADESSETMERYRYKQSEEMTQDMEGFLLELEDRLPEIHDVTYTLRRDGEKRGETFTMTMTVSQILELFYERFAAAPLLTRMDMIAERFIDEFETLYLFRRGEEMEPPEKEAVYALFRNMFLTRDPYEIYRLFLRDMDLPELPDVPREERILNYEDVYPLLYLKYRLMKKQPSREVRHLIIDEMQDYSYLQYRILQILFDCPMTILGDRAQSLEPGQRDVMEFLPSVFGRKCRRLTLNRSYRNTLEIASYAKSIHQIDGIDYFERHGRPVDLIAADTLAEAVCQLEEILELPDPDVETTAILCLTEGQARETWERLKTSKINENMSYLDRNSRHFTPGIVVTTWYLAKGLEFDRVFVMPVSKQSQYYSQYLYICATRAMHQLTVFGESGH